MSIPDHLVGEVLALPPESRAELLVLLQNSLPESEQTAALAHSDDRLAIAWTDELDRRLARYRSDESPGIEVDRAMAQIRQQLSIDRDTSGQ
jgi:putative addiction module component (TIGR02574 family)